MTYREKMDEYKKGNLSPEESAEIEKDIEKFTVLLDYIDEKSMNTAITFEDDGSSEEFLGNINSLINKRINKSAIRVLLTGLVFVVFFFWGIWGGSFEGNGYDGLINIINGFFSLGYYAVNIILLYRAFVYKVRKPAVFIILWNSILFIMTYGVSILISDAAPFVLPVYKGFSTLILQTEALISLVAGVELSLFPLWLPVMPLLSVVLAVIALVLAKKDKSFRKIGKKSIIIPVLAGLLFTSVVSVGSTAADYMNGHYLHDQIGHTLSLKAARELDDVFIINNPLEKTEDELRELLNEKGYSYFDESGCYRKDRNANMTASVYLSETSSSRHVGLDMNYVYIGTGISRSKLEKISGGIYFSKGASEKEVLKELCRLSLYPRMIDFVVSEEGALTTCSVQIKIPDSSSFPGKYIDFLQFEFNNGVLTGFSSHEISYEEWQDTMF